MIDALHDRIDQLRERTEDWTQRPNGWPRWSGWGESVWRESA
jgi:hypothetical protein